MNNLKYFLIVHSNDKSNVTLRSTNSRNGCDECEWCKICNFSNNYTKKKQK